jgi:hypothetical protein
VHRASSAVLLAVIGCISGSGTGEVDRDEMYKCSSPTRTHVAIFQMESGGGAAGFAYERVYVRGPDEQESRVLSLKGGYDVRLRWRDSMHLQIEYPDNARVDHWQSWFGPGTDGRVEVIAMPSRGGKLMVGAGGCTS